MSWFVILEFKLFVLLYFCKEKEYGLIRKLKCLFI